MDEMLSRDRRYRVVHARHDLMYRLRAELRWSLTRIGLMLDCDHTTVLYGVRKHAARCSLPVPKVEAVQ